jgi:putative heme-binding domain-containing protein
VRLHVAGALETEYQSSKSSTRRGWDVSLFERWQESDPQVVLMMWYAIEQQARLEPKRARSELSLGLPPVILRNSIRLEIDRAGPELPRLLDQIFDVVQNNYDPREPRTAAIYVNILSALRESLSGRKGLAVPPSWPEALATLRKTAPPELIREAEALGVLFGDQHLIALLLKRITDTNAKVEERRSAIELLASRKVPGSAKTLHSVLDVPTVRGAAIRALATSPDANTPAAILKAYSTFTPEEKLDAVHTLASRSPWANALLEAVEKGKIPRSDVPVTTARQILALNDKAVSARLEKVWGKITPASKVRAALTKKWKEILSEGTLAKADATRGRVLFTKHCAACHKMFGEGQTVGPELTGSQRANIDYVLENVLDPSAVVPNEYRLINFTTADERLVSGIVVRETKDAVTVRTTNDTVILPTADIAARKQTNVSIMPDGLFDQMKPDEVRDLIAYLRAKQQVPIPK